LKKSIKYFSKNIRINDEWIEQPFIVDIMVIKMSTHIEIQAIELFCVNKLKQMLSETSSEFFWAHLCMGNYAEI